jgi:hypothetical protein
MDRVGAQRTASGRGRRLNDRDSPRCATPSRIATADSHICILGRAISMHATFHSRARDVSSPAGGFTCRPTGHVPAPMASMATVRRTSREDRLA